MHLKLYTSLESVSPEQLEADLLRLPAWRREKALAYRPFLCRVQSVRAYLALCELLEEHYGITTPPDFSYGDNGKPFLRDYPDIHFSLSHCRDAVLCVVDTQPIGCDIETINRKITPALIRYCFNEEEVREIENAACPQEAFCRLWTIKESVLKLTGEGIGDNLRTLLTPELKEKIRVTTSFSNDPYLYYSISQFATGDK